jgi:hypothetical protein
MTTYNGSDLRRENLIVKQKRRAGVNLVAY